MSKITTAIAGPLMYNPAPYIINLVSTRHIHAVLSTLTGEQRLIALMSRMMISPAPVEAEPLEVLPTRSEAKGILVLYGNRIRADLLFG